MFFLSFEVLKTIVVRSPQSRLSCDALLQPGVSPAVVLIPKYPILFLLLPCLADGGNDTYMAIGGGDTTAKGGRHTKGDQGDESCRMLQ